MLISFSQSLDSFCLLPPCQSTMSLPWLSRGHNYPTDWILYHSTFRSWCVWWTHNELSLLELRLCDFSNLINAHVIALTSSHLLIVMRHWNLISSSLAMCILSGLPSSTIHHPVGSRIWREHISLVTIWVLWDRSPVGEWLGMEGHGAICTLQRYQCLSRMSKSGNWSLQESGLTWTHHRSVLSGFSLVVGILLWLCIGKVLNTDQYFQR